MYVCLKSVDIESTLSSGELRTGSCYYSLTNKSVVVVVNYGQLNARVYHYTRAHMIALDCNYSKSCDKKW